MITQQNSDDEIADIAGKLEYIAAHVLNIGPPPGDEKHTKNGNETSELIVRMCTVDSKDNCEAFFALTCDSAISYALWALISAVPEYNDDFLAFLLVRNSLMQAAVITLNSVPIVVIPVSLKTSTNNIG